MPITGGSGLTIGSSALSGGTEGSVLFVGAGGVIDQDNAAFFYDNTNNRMGVGTNSPAREFHARTNAINVGYRATNDGLSGTSMEMGVGTAYGPYFGGTFAGAGGFAFALAGDVVPIVALALDTSQQVNIGRTSIRFKGFIGTFLDVQQTTLGTSVAKISTVATNSDPTCDTYQNRVATTDATVTTLHTIAIPASTTVGISGHVVARRTGGTAGTAEDGAFYKVEAVYKNVAGTATQIGATITAIGEDQAGWDVTLAVSTSNALVQVTGAVDNNITWHWTGDIYPIGS